MAKENKISSLMEFVQESINFRGAISRVNLRYAGREFKNEIRQELQTMSDVTSGTAIFWRLIQIVSDFCNRKGRYYGLSIKDADLVVKHNHDIVLNISYNEVKI